MELTIRRPDDWHLHLRDDATLASVLPYTSKVFGRAIVMPNLKPPVRNLADAAAYRERILAALPEGHAFEPLMTLYLTDVTTPDDIREAAASGFVVACKLYPAGATTNSDAGVTDIAGLDDVLATMAEVGMLLLVHGEVTHGEVDIFDREARFIEQVLTPIVARHPTLKVVLEHITTAEAVAFVRQAPPTVAATITAHHLLLNRNAIFEGGINPHHYCLPILKRERHRKALVDAATSGSARFFLGTDSAPHAVEAKESACGCAGMFTAPNALELYAEVFEAEGALDKLEGFASEFGPAFYGLPANEGTVTLVKGEQAIPASLPMGDSVVVPFRAGGTTSWTVASVDATR